MLLGFNCELDRCRQGLRALSFEDTRNAMENLPVKPA